jgi:hypothetical protein
VQPGLSSRRGSRRNWASSRLKMIKKAKKAKKVKNRDLRARNRVKSHG